jgi:hypothetical protein
VALERLTAGRQWQMSLISNLLHVQTEVRHFCLRQ